jgi:hypothetical protein
MPDPMAIEFASMSGGCKRPAKLAVMSAALMHGRLTTGIAPVGTICFTRGLSSHWTSSLYLLCPYRWNGDPATTARVVPRAHGGLGLSRSAGGEEGVGEEDSSFDPLLSSGPRSQHMLSVSLGTQIISLPKPLLRILKHQRQMDLPQINCR